MTECIGVKRKIGNMTNDAGEYVEWDNVLIFISSDEDPDCIGKTSEQIKIKAPEFEKFTCLSLDDWKSLYNKKLNLFYSLIEGKSKLTRIQIEFTEEERAKLKHPSALGAGEPLPESKVIRGR